MSYGPIPWRDMVAYATFHEIDSELFPIFKTVMRAMDAKFLEFSAKQVKGSGRDNTPEKPKDTRAPGERVSEVAPPKRTGKYARQVKGG
jgi:hypothetical protein